MQSGATEGETLAEVRCGLQPAGDIRGRMWGLAAKVFTKLALFTVIQRYLALYGEMEVEPVVRVIGAMIWSASLVCANSGAVSHG